MRLEEIRIQNYRSIDDVTLRFPPNKPVVLLGPNNAGKTSILSAIQTVNTNDDQGTGKLNEDGTMSFTEDEIGKFFANRGIKRLWQESNEAGCYAGVTDSTVISLSFEDKEGRIIEKEISFQYDSGKKKFLPKEKIKALSIWPPVPAEKKYFTAAFYEKDAESELKEGSWQKDLFDSIRNGIERSIDQVAGFQGLSLDTKQPHTAASNPFNCGDGEKSYFLRLNPLESAEKLAKLSKNIGSDTPHHLVLMDEPETHLHPNAEEALLEGIEKACQEGVQVVYATHSENFLKTDDLEGFVRVYKENGITKVRQLTKEELFYTCHIRGEDTYKELPIGEHYYSVKINSDQLKGFFADIILLVEGQTEYYALPIYLSRLFLSKRGIQIVTCGSKSAIQTYWRLFTAYGYKCFVLYDHDTDEDKERAKDGRSDLNKELELFFNDKKQPGEGYSFCLTAACFKKNWEDYFEKDLGSEYKVIKDDLEENYEISFAKDREKASRAKAIALRSKEIGHRDIPFINDLERQLEELGNMSKEDYAKYVETVKEKLREIKNSQSKDR